MILPIVISVVTIASLAWLARGAASSVHSCRELEGRLRPIDIIALRMLIDPGEEEFLRSVLQPARLRRVQRARAIALADYVLRAARNAAILIRLGQAEQKSEIPEARVAARKVIQASIRLRLYAFAVLCKLSIRMIFPNASLAVSEFVPSYESVRGDLGRLVEIAEPAEAHALSRASL